MKSELAITFFSVCLFLFGAWLSYLDGMFLPSQMVKKYPMGFPFIANGAMWGNLIFISLVLYVAGKYEREWSGIEMQVAFLVGVVASYLMFHFVYQQGKFPDALAGAKQMRLAGWVMVLYSGVAVTIIGLFYFYSHPTAADVVTVGVLLALYIVAANHVPLAWLNGWYHFPWCPDIFAEEKTPLLIMGGSGILLAGVTAIKLWLR